MTAGPMTPTQGRYEAKQSSVFPPLHDLPGISVRQQEASQVREDVFDTPDDGLGRWGIVLRRSTDAAGTVWTRTVLPGEPDGSGTFAAGPGAGQEVPVQLLEGIRGYVRGRELRPVRRKDTRRLTYALVDDAGLPAGSVSDEQVSVQDADGRLLTAGREWVTEGLAGNLEELVRELFAGSGARPVLPGQAARGERDAAPVPAANATMGGVLMAYLADQYAELLQQESRVRCSDPEGIHKMRVSTRRMRSVLASYRRILEPEPARRLRGELKWAAAVLGAARDVQVMHKRLQALLAGQQPELVLGPVSARIDADMARDYQQAFGHVLQMLADDRYFQLLADLEELIDHPALTPAAGEGAREATLTTLRKDRRRLRRTVRSASAMGPAARADGLHEARKEAKRLRYAAELSGPVQPGVARGVADAAERVQKVLGEHQDSVVTRQHLRRMGAAATERGENGFTFGRLHALEELRGDAAEESFNHVWKGFPRIS